MSTVVTVREAEIDLDLISRDLAYADGELFLALDETGRSRYRALADVVLYTIASREGKEEDEYQRGWNDAINAAMDAVEMAR